MTKSSLEAYVKGIENGTIQNAKADVYRYIKKHPNSLIIDLYNNMAISEHTISARVSDLLDAGFIKVIGESKGYSILNVVSNQNEMKLLSVQRANERKKRAIKTLLKYNLLPSTESQLRVELKLVK